MRNRVIKIVLLCALSILLSVTAIATVNTAANKVVVAGNGSQTAFNFTFVGVATADISVIYTDASGNQTTLVSGSGATQYQLALTAASPGTIWGIGGTVTYNPSGIPIATGTTLTILRTLPLLQTVSLSNQGSFLPKAIETALDLLSMQIQQLNEAYGRAIIVAPSDPTPTALPPAAQRANLALIFDSLGNPIAGAVPSSGTISSAMQPVVNSATLAAGRSAFGLGSMATEAINSGTCGGTTIQDDGSGNARVVFATGADSTNQAVHCSSHMQQRICTGPITYTLDRGNTLFNGFGFWLYAKSGLCTVTPNANDNFTGVASGGSIGIAAGAVCFITTNAASSATWQINCSGTSPSLSASSNGTALTITLNGVRLDFRDTTLTQGDPLWAIPTGALSITVPSLATLGTSSSNVPFRIWIFAAYNGGTPVLGVATCSNATSIFGCTAWETQQKTGTAIGAGSTSAGTLYTASGVTNDAVRIIGYADYATGLATAGTWASAPTTLQLCTPPFVCKRPGDLVQTVRSTTGAVATGTTAITANDTIPTNTTGDQYMSLAVTPTAQSNLLVIDWQGQFANTTGQQLAAALFQDATANALSTSFVQIQVGTESAQIHGNLQMIAATVSSTTFKVRAGANTGATTTFNGQTGSRLYGGGLNSYIIIYEIMGALEPANDNGEPQRLAG